MSQVVLPALIPDIPRIYQIYFDAFRADKMGALMLQVLFPVIVDQEFIKAHAAGTLSYWHLSDCHVIAIDPQRQGRKAGALIVQWGIDLGEQAGLPVYFESSLSTVGLYTKMGFEVLQEQINVVVCKWNGVQRVV
ncbi:hypothetical protein MY11210_009140 [Beauveria gryllotalpidicola]